MLDIRDIDVTDRSAAVELWKECGLTVPWNDPIADYDRALENPSSKILGGFIDEELVSTLMVGYEGHRGWIYYLAVAQAYRRNGLAKRLIYDAELWLRSLGAPKVMLMVRKGNTDGEALYESLGYEVSDVTTYGKFFS